MESLFIGERGRERPRHTILESFAGDVIVQVADTARISPLIVIPRDYFDTIACNYSCHGSVNNRGTGITAVVNGDQFLRLVSEVALQRSAFGGLLHDGI